MKGVAIQPRQARVTSVASVNKSIGLYGQQNRQCLYDNQVLGYFWWNSVFNLCCLPQYTSQLIILTAESTTVFGQSPALQFVVGSPIINCSSHCQRQSVFVSTVIILFKKNNHFLHVSWNEWQMEIYWARLSSY